MATAGYPANFRRSLPKSDLNRREEFVEHDAVHKALLALLRQDVKALFKHIGSVEEPSTYEIIQEKTAYWFEMRNGFGFLVFVHDAWVHELRGLRQDLSRYSFHSWCM
ncbi:hypothetical protein C1H46_018860 [Malus baccata]|uniref:Uncharacterized protein n=1 Tax=Malus baccata TaxID=106549 RepID=A0A540M9S1_MALBA|nr:hypothetical protein C1H46_018860 [Malus baccata]